MIVYSSCTLEGANWEYTHTARSSQLKVAELLPIFAMSVRVQLSRVLDLTDLGVRRTLKVTVADLCSADWIAAQDEALTQTIGRLAFDAGFEAILAPSGGGSPNLNIMLGNVLLGSTLQIINKNELPSSI